MCDHKPVKLIKLIILALTAAFLCSDLPSQETAAGSAQQQPRRRFEIIGSQVPFNQRIGDEDGALFAIHFTGDTRGRPGPCG
ncbi:MAG: hypothetical protein L0229_02695 [Blastocatellia bacterium]|nr:hypothetical protein [Blastocatellia bacterium]